MQRQRLLQTEKLQGIKNILKRNDTSVVLATLLIFGIFAVSSEGFLSAYNLFNVSRTASLYIVIALGQAMVLIVGGMNLSLGAIGGLSVVGAGYCMQVLGLPSWLAVIISFLVGISAGAMNGYIITKMKLNAFVVTLATSFVYTGLVFGISKGFPYTEIPKSFTTIGRQWFLGIPYLLWLVIVVLLVVTYIFKYTVVGRRLLATGGNEDAARLSGIKTNRIIILANTLSGFFAALAGVLWISRMGSAQPATGSDWMIISFAVAVIGGTALQGGAISTVALFASGYLIAFVKNGLVMLGVNVYFEPTFLGLIILLAVSVDRLKQGYTNLKKV